MQASGVVLEPGQTFSTQGQTENGKHMSKYSEEVVSPCLSHHRPQSGESWNELNTNGENIFSHFLNANTNQKTWPNPDKKKWLRAGLCVWENPHTGTYDRRSFHTDLVYGIRSKSLFMAYIIHLWLPMFCSTLSCFWMAFHSCVCLGWRFCWCDCRFMAHSCWKNRSHLHVECTWKPPQS